MCEMTSNNEETLQKVEELAEIVESDCSHSCPFCQYFIWADDCSICLKNALGQTAERLRERLDV